ncbi:MAG: hypothetical protein ABIP49_02575 [Lysobacterales bacterium]
MGFFTLRGDYWVLAGFCSRGSSVIALRGKVAVCFASVAASAAGSSALYFAQAYRTLAIIGARKFFIALLLPFKRLSAASGAQQFRKELPINSFEPPPPGDSA